MCPGCHQNTTSEKAYSVLSLPSVLLFQLKRFNNKQAKLCRLMNFPLVGLSFEGHTFNLCSVVYPHGSINSGHYSAALLENDHWFSANDDKVDVIDARSVITPDAYLLIYSQIS